MTTTYSSSSGILKRKQRLEPSSTCTTTGYAFAVGTVHATTQSSSSAVTAVLADIVGVRSLIGSFFEFTTQIIVLDLPFAAQFSATARLSARVAFAAWLDKITTRRFQKIVVDHYTQQHLLIMRVRPCFVWGLGRRLSSRPANTKNVQYCIFHSRRTCTYRTVSSNSLVKQII